MYVPEFSYDAHVSVTEMCAFFQSEEEPFCTFQFPLHYSSGNTSDFPACSNFFLANNLCANLKKDQLALETRGTLQTPVACPLVVTVCDCEAFSVCRCVID